MANRVVPQVLLPRQESPIHIEGPVAYVAIGRGQEAIISSDDIPIIKGRPWRMMTTPSGHAYAYAGNGKKQVLMHRLLLSAGPGFQVDHINGDGIDNRRSNIRIATPTLNQANRAVERRNKIGLKGVSMRAHSKGAKPYRAVITPNGKKIYLGSFSTKEEAAAAYAGAAKALWGDFAKHD